jgi:hypothetical protein
MEMSGRLCTALLVALCLYTTIGCAASSEGETSGASEDGTSGMKLLTASEVKRTLRHLPYRFEFRAVELPDGASSAVAGTAFGRHRTIVRFGISFGRAADAVPVPRAGTDSTFTYHGLFVYTDDLQWRNARGKLVTTPRLKTRAQWHEAWEINVDITDRLCKSATGEPCPV